MKIIAQECKILYNLKNRIIDLLCDRGNIRIGEKAGGKKKSKEHYGGFVCFYRHFFTDLHQFVLRVG